MLVVNTPDLVEGIKWYLVFLGSTTVHEAAHAWSALKLGDDTAARGGLASLDPTVHLFRSPLGMVVVPILSWLAQGSLLGWASAPYNGSWAFQNPRRGALMALAGPAANLALMLLGALLLHVGLEWSVFELGSARSPAHLVIGPPGSLRDFAASLLSIAVSLNLLLACFNLLPAPPLDGASLPLLALSRPMAEKYLLLLRRPFASLLGLVLAWNFFGVLFEPVRRTALNLLGLDPSIG